MLITLSILSLLLTISLSLISYLSIKRIAYLVNTLETVQNQVEESLDIIDNCYTKIVKISEIPVVYDDPTVRSLIVEIKNTKNAVLLIANKLVSFSNENNESDEQEVTQ